jgi:hypothetical protein
VTEDAVQRPREANRESADAARQRAAMFGLGDEMDVIILHGVLDDPKMHPRSGRKRALDRREDATRAETADCRGGP